MPTTIRLKRMGRKRQPTYRIVVVDSARAVTGPSIERLGLYNPRTEPSLLELDAARTLHWLRAGAEPSDTVRSLLRRAGVWEQFHAGVAPEELEETEIVLGPAPDQRKTSRRPTPAAAAAAAGRSRPSAEAAGVTAERAVPAEEVSAPADTEPPVETEAELADAGTSPEEATPTAESGVAPPDAAGQDEPVPDEVETASSAAEGAAEEEEVRATEALAADAATVEADTEEADEPAPGGTDESDAIREGSAVPSAEKTEPAAAPASDEEASDDEESPDEEVDDEK